MSVTSVFGGSTISESADTATMLKIVTSQRDRFRGQINQLQEENQQLQMKISKLNSEVETLRSFEREYRSRLKSYFSQQLEALAGPGTAESVSEETPAPKRLRSILGEEEG